MESYDNDKSDKDMQTKIEKALLRTTDTRECIMGAGVVSSTGELFKKCFPGAKAIIIADNNTWRVAGQQVSEALGNSGVEQYEPFIFDDPDFYAEWKFVEMLEKHLKDIDAVAIAVGSGVINDLTKYTSHILGRKYMCVGTAASMDGFTAYGASITKDGNKQTFSCPAPFAFLMDPRIPAKAPQGMSASGYADLIAKVPAGADWLLADALGVEPLDAFAFSLVQDGLKEALSDPAGIKEGNVLETMALCEGLLMSGFAMQAMHSSRPASGIEHQFSHYWDMEGLSYPDGRHVSHGFKVGIGTLVSTAVWEYLLERNLDDISPERLSGRWPGREGMLLEIKRIFQGKPGHLQRAVEETSAKYIGPAELLSRLHRFLECWPSLKTKIKAQLYPYDELYCKLKTVGAPVEPEQIFVSRMDLRDAFRRIPYMRSRYTVIDIVCELGLMAEVENHLFGNGGRWQI